MNAATSWHEWAVVRRFNSGLVSDDEAEGSGSIACCSGAITLGLKVEHLKKTYSTCMYTRLCSV